MKQQPPADTTLVHLLRHGEVDNPRGILYGRLPGYHLSERGREMAELVAAYLADVPLNHLVSSPLERAQETMAPIAATRPEVGVQLDERVIEASNKFEGQKFGRDNAALKDPRNWLLLRNPMVPSWGEPYKQIAARMHAAVADAAAAAGENGQALIVSHQLPIWMARCDAEGRRLMHDPRKRDCTVASITTFHVRDGHVVRVSYDEPARSLLRNAKRGNNISAGA